MHILKGQITAKWLWLVCLQLIAVLSFSANAQEELNQGLIRAEYQGQKVYLLAEQTQVEMHITGLINRVKVTQTFSHDYPAWLQGNYQFPLPENAAVDSMKMRIGDRIIEGEIQPKAKAKQQFEQAKRQGKQASLVSQQRPNLFTTELANIGPDYPIVVEIEYQQIVNVDADILSIRFPMAITPRYYPQRQFDASSSLLQSSISSLNSMQQSSVKLAKASNSHYATINVTFDDANAVHSVTSLAHPIDQTLIDNKLVINLPIATPQNQDFRLQWQHQQTEQVLAAAFYQQGQTHKAHLLNNPRQVDDDVYAMALILPPKREYKASHQIPRELVLVLDTSGSMSGESIIQAKQAILEALDGLTPQDSFNVIEFNSVVTPLFSDSVMFTDNHIKLAKQFIASRKADGGTELALALDAALVRPTSYQGDTAQQKLRQVIFITDGAVGNEQALFEQIQYQLGDSRLFTVGIGSAPNSHFMTRAAQMGKGTFTYIGRLEEVSTQMSDLLAKISQPVLTDIEVNYLDGSIPDYWPATIPDLYQAQPLMVSLRAKANQLQPIIVSGMIDGQPWQQTLAQFQLSEEAKGIDIVWANAQINALELSQSRASMPRVAKQVEAIAMQYHVVSSQTSLVAVDKTPVVSNVDLSQISFGQLLPKGWQHPSMQAQMLPQTSTNSRLHLLLGLLMTILTLLYASYVYLGQRRSDDVDQITQ